MSGLNLSLLIGLGVVTFLIVLNGYLRGSRRTSIDAVLGVGICTLLLVILIRVGWIAALVALALTFVFAGLSKPLGSRIARKSLGCRTAFGHSSIPSGFIERSQHDPLLDQQHLEARLARLATGTPLRKPFSKQSSGVRISLRGESGES